jgi:hypothetical protein
MARQWSAIGALTLTRRLQKIAKFLGKKARLR